MAKKRFQITTVFFILMAFSLLLLTIYINSPCGCQPNSEPPCPTSLPDQALANCQIGLALTDQAIFTQAHSAAHTLVAQTVHSAALSATATHTPTHTPTPTATSTPIPTSTIWRVNPITTPVAMTIEPFDMFGVEELPTSTVGRPWKSNSFDSDFDGKPDRFLYTILTLKQEVDWRQSLRAFQENKAELLGVEDSSFAVYDTLDIDLNGDEAPETLFAYHLGTLFGIAVMRDGQILDVMQPNWQSEYIHDVRLIGVPFSPTQNAVLIHLSTVSGGSGIYPVIYRRMILLEDEKLQTTWDWKYLGGGRGGAGFQKYNNEKIRFAHLTNQPEINILLSRSTEHMNLPADNPANYINYNLHLPGELVFSWVGEKYELTHYYQNKVLTPIHATDFIAFAPEMSKTITVDGNDGDWSQTEYLSGLNGYGRENHARSYGLRYVSAAWSTGQLLFNLNADPNSTIWLTFDTDLQNDLAFHSLNKDDFVFRITLSDGLQCHLSEVSAIHPKEQPLPDIKKQSDRMYGICTLEISLPFASIGFPTPQMAPAGFALSPLTPNESTRFSLSQYFPSAGALMGFSAFAENTFTARYYDRERIVHFDPYDPATWGTLIFISDH